MRVLETDRLALRRMTLDDAAFIFKLVNEPAWLQFIGDKNVRSLEDAQRYIQNGPLEMYARFGFGLFVIELKASGEPIGACGLIKRDSLPDADLGYALLSPFWGKGYAREAAAAVLSHGHREHGLQRILAIMSPDNVSSERVLEKCGMHFERMLSLSPDNEVKLFAIQFSAG